MIARSVLLLLVSGCALVGDPCPGDYECPEVPEEPKLATYEADLEPGTEDPPIGTLEVLEDAVVLEYTDENGDTWRVTWPRD